MVRVNIYLDEETHKLIKKASKKEERSFSNFVSVSGKQRAKQILNKEAGTWENN